MIIEKYIDGWYILECTDCHEQIEAHTYYDSPSTWFPHRRTCEHYTLPQEAKKLDIA